MKKSSLILASALLCATAAMAQRTPTHPLDIKDGDFDSGLKLIGTWKAGKAPEGVSAIDDQFYISRQRPMPRITDGDYTAVKGVNPERKMCLWVPLDDPTSSWKALPRYCFEGDNFSLWSYVNIHGNWTAPWFRVTSGLTDVAHKNGVAVGCVYSIPWAASVTLSGSNKYSQVWRKLTERDENDNFKYVDNFVKMLRYYGIDGIGVNSEFNSDYDTMEEWREFIKACHKRAKELNWHFQLHWYDYTGDSGQNAADRGLGSHNKENFGTGDDIVTDMLFANYNWNNTVLANTVTNAKKYGRSSFDYYAGFDIQGRGLKAWNGWSCIANNNVSIGFWGAHSQSLIHQSATDEGTSDVAIQQAYLTKQEMIYSGGNRNPLNLPPLNNSCDLGNASLKNFHGLATFLSAKSTIMNVPFVSRFNLGNGLSFRNEGKVTFNHKWHNINTQDIMPTWRWWIVNANEKATEGDLANADLTWDDAYFGGSCLRLSGATKMSRIKLFKTMLAVKPDYKFSVTYKMNNELATHAKLFVALRDKLNDYKEIAIPDAGKYGEWTTFTATAAQLGLKDGDQVAMMGIRLDNTAKDYNMLIGEMAVRNPQQTFATATPVIKQVEMLRGKGSSLDFKMRYESKDQTGLEVPTYNDEVGTWYFEIFMQQENQPEQLLTATTSWAAYVIDAPLVSGFEGRKARFGVRAVSPDGVQKSPISWTEYKDIPYDSPSSEVVLDRDVIKPNETFTCGLEDAMAEPAKQWQVVNSQTGKVLLTKQNVKNFTTSIAELGSYDVVMTDSKNVTTTLRGKIQITPESTGALPTINTFSVNKNQAKTGEEVTYNYAYRKGEGTVSRALRIQDPDMLMIPQEVQTGKVWSYALWVKAESYAHDKQGTNLISKNTIEDSWPTNNWGDIWVQIRPEIKAGTSSCKKAHAANEVSLNTYGWTAHDDPNEAMMSTGYSLNPGLWNHIVVTQDASKVQQIYFNGKRVANATVIGTKRREDGGVGGTNRNAVANIFIGGGGVYKAGFTGWVDDVQVWNKALTEDEVKKAMNGFDTNNVPTGLQAYYTFEDYNKADSTFANHGHAGPQYVAKMVRTAAAGGESTAKAYYAKQSADNLTAGYPGIAGSLPIKTTKKLKLNGARISSESDEAAVVTYAMAGTYSATLSLTNPYGTIEKTLENVVEITGETAINDVKTGADFSVFPNPFVESVNFRFAEAGNYTVNVLTTNGQLLQTNNFEAGAGQVVNVAMSGANGMYLVQVVKDGKIYKSVKVIKK